MIAALFTGSLLGACAGRSLATGIQARIGEAELESYAQRLFLTGKHLATDVNQAHKTMKESKYDFCSDEEIALMQRVVFSSHTIKEIERIRNDQVQCTALLGRLKHPSTFGPPDIQLNHLKVYLAAPVPSSGGSRGYINQWSDTAVVINPIEAQDMDELPMTYAGHYYTRDPGTKAPRIIPAFGHDMPLSPTEELSGKLLEKDGVLYLPRCTAVHSFCIIAAEPKRAILVKTHRVHILVLWTGAIVGALLALVPLFFLRNQRTMENQLRRAIRNEALKLVYQPVIALDENRIVGAEVLLRWKNESGEAVRPDVFIHVAEEHGFISRITDYVIDHSLHEMHGLLTSGNFHISINIASHDLIDPQFCHRIDGKLKAAHVDAKAFALELTERSTANNEDAIECIAYLHNAGHPLYLDDFGTGYSSLAYLHRLKVSAIKIDRSFTQTIGTEAIAASLVPQILAIASELDLKVVVEGIETQEQREYFRNAGSGIFGQGYLLGRPMLASQLKALLAAQDKTMSIPTAC
jgi:sensor c-di-GMP phosphodiesterase-like protein